MKVRDIMETNVITVSPDTSYHDIARILYEKNISGMPVVDAAGEVLGIVSEKDIFRVLYPSYQNLYDDMGAATASYLEGREKEAQQKENIPASAFMTKNVIQLHPDDPIMKAGSLMLAKNISRFPVVENGRVVGVISRKMIYRAILKKSFGF